METQNPQRKTAELRKAGNGSPRRTADEPSRRVTAYRSSRHRKVAKQGGIGIGVLAAGLAGLPAASPAQEAAAQRLEEVVVTSSIIETPRRRIGTAVSVLEGEDIALRGYNAVADVLRTQPGIGVSNSGGAGKTTTLRIRGEEGYRTLLMIDGVKAMDPTGPQVAPSIDSLLTTSDLERVEVLRGPQGFMYGADAGGVVNILTRTGEGDLRGRLGVEYGGLGTRKVDASAAGGGEAGDYFVSVTDLETDGFNAQTADTALADDDGAQNTTLHTKLGWNASESVRLQLVARDIDATAFYDGCFSTTTFATTHDCTSTTEQTTYKVSADYDSGPFTNAFGYSKLDIARDDLSEGISAFGSHGELDRFEYTGSFRPTDAATLVYGLDRQEEKIVSGEPDERYQEGYYLEYQGQFGENVFLSAGARYDDNEDFGTHTSTRVSGAYVRDLRDGGSLKYRASFGTGFRAPSLSEIAFNQGPFAAPPAAGVVLTEESSRGHDLGIEYDHASGLNFSATYFDQEIEDEIFFDLAGSSGYLQSPGTSTSTGLELAVEAPVGSRWVLLGNWTRNDTENTDNEQRLRRPKSFGNIGLLYTASNDRLRLIANYRLSRDSIDIGNAALDDYEVLDISMLYSLNDNFELHARVLNAADENYQELIGYHTAGRTGYAGVRLRF